MKTKLYFPVFLFLLMLHVNCVLSQGRNGGYNRYRTDDDCTLEDRLAKPGTQVNNEYKTYYPGQCMTLSGNIAPQVSDVSGDPEIVVKFVDNEPVMARSKNQAWELEYYMRGDDGYSKIYTIDGNKNRCLIFKGKKEMNSWFKYTYLNTSTVQIVTYSTEGRSSGGGSYSPPVSGFGNSGSYGSGSSSTKRTCTNCGGGGGCKGCHGTGKVKSSSYYTDGHDMIYNCPSCGGTGRCGVCHGRGSL